MSIDTIIATVVEAAANDNWKQLFQGAYISKDKPILVTEKQFDDFAGVDDQPIKAVLEAYNKNEGRIFYCWEHEVPRLLSKITGMEDLLSKAPKIFSDAKGAQYLSELSDGFTGFCYKGPGGYLTIGFSND